VKVPVYLLGISTIIVVFFTSTSGANCTNIAQTKTFQSYMEQKSVLNQTMFKEPLGSHRSQFASACKEGNKSNLTNLKNEYLTDFRIVTRNISEANLYYENLIVAAEKLGESSCVEWLKQHWKKYIDAPAKAYNNAHDKLMKKCDPKPESLNNSGSLPEGSPAAQ
jgi:hypothetical protein